MQIREIRRRDAGSFLAFLRQLDLETEFMLLEPGERTEKVAEQEKWIQEILSHPNQTVFIAEEGEKIFGFIEVFGGGFRRNRATAHLVLGLLREARGQGWGSKLLHAAENWARQHRIHRLELTVMTYNVAAVSLYEKMGFQREGTRKHSLILEDRFVDEYYMGKILD
ncbi:MULTISPECIES: GNAT family N-acetyltransferase [unclassified Thermoactinomyces]|jgi:RimJ/RimL family protein N-acetyltransferase|nr:MULTISPECIES: GNAT family N-acetyltransferase [unclassified Thermoactinomyces]MBH8597263.1 GNAT family N-acetyltransferase [Thermoactinomyces sp. CICC 10523]MBH8602824.1 GNAT family N-acetyltransferase [Thermoactinomyces sp. CICC 10522]MBH8606068.1 GNAT family N-acetyltransferase [Thermoactinomyces sp. CICC 10521]